MPPFRSNPFLFAPDDGAGGGADLDAAAAAADARIADAPPPPADDGGGTPPPPPPPPPAATDDPYAGLHDTLGKFSEPNRNAFIEAAPQLGEDLAYLTSAASGLHPDDRRYFLEVMSLMGSGDTADRAKAVEMFQHGVEALTAGNEPEGGDPDLVPDTGQMTAAQVEQLMERRLGEERQRVEQERLMEEISREARGLGYDPGAPDDSPETARFESLLSLAARNNGDLTKAHELLEADAQRRIDAFVASRRDAALRPVAPTAGGSPSPQRGPATTLDEAEARMEERLNSAYGG